MMSRQISPCSVQQLAQEFANTPRTLQGFFKSQLLASAMRV